MANKVTSKEILEGKDQFVYLDVREADELEEGKIDASNNIPLGQLIRNCLDYAPNRLKKEETHEKYFPRGSKERKISQDYVKNFATYSI